MKHRNIITGETQIPTQLNGRQNVTWENSQAELIAVGWRIEPEAPELVANMTRISKTFVEGDGATGAWEVVDRLTSEIEAEAAEAQAQAEYQASLPVPMPTGIEAPVVVLTDSDGKGWGVVADGGDLVTYPDHASPRPDAATIAARIAAARAEGKAHRDRIAAIQTDLDQAEAALEAINVTASGALGTAIAATTGVNKTALTAVRTTLVDFKTAAKNLRQAAEKLRKEVK